MINSASDMLYGMPLAAASANMTKECAPVMQPVYLQKRLNVDKKVNQDAREQGRQRTRWPKATLAGHRRREQ
jgi:hypothetical protein